MSSVLWSCPECKKVMQRKNLYPHLRVVHFYTREQIEGMKSEVSRQAAQEGAPPYEEVICPLCEERFVSHKRLAAHCEEEHADEGADGEPQNYAVFTVSFANKQEFDRWLDEQQQESGTTFYTRSSSKLKGLMELRCNRAGKYVKRTEDRATKSKRDVSHCSCFLSVKMEEDGSVHAEGCLGHAGHKIDRALLRLTPSQQQFLKGLLEEFTPDYIIKRLRRDYPANVSRLHYVTKGDLWSIVNRFELRPGFRHKEDMASLKARKDEGNPDDGIRLLELPEESTGRGFRMIIFTRNRRGISIDDTHNATRYDLKLATVMVMNERDAGVPAAFLLSGSMTAQDVEKLFLEIREVVPEFDPIQVVTDEAPCFYNGFRAVFPNSRAKLHYCRWHVEKTWQRNANKLVEKISVMQANVNALVNTDTEEAMELLTAINELVSEASRIGLTAIKGIAARPELTHVGGKPKLTRVQLYTRQQSRVTRSALSHGRPDSDSED
ncbi:unnamed protein product [Haemonchus placei]|uniref:C2H2-type domain-containing protein n=1 Tax=Haemonchus placei TaxID=6290 RepID=A0A0N4WFL0_HAEPC|nr:unnamed protein product [Haemonchus placei]